MPQKPLFTIIVSGYQNEPFLPQCLASISGQTFGNFEAICYVEESTDNSLAICQEWARRDPRFIVATGPKSGSPSATRNYGIDHAQGEYLVVVDGDDWIVPDMLETLAAKLDTTGSLDVLAFAAQSSPPPKVSQCSGKMVISNFRESDDGAGQVFSGLEAIRRIHEKDKSSLSAYTWLNIYRIAFLQEHHLRQIVGKSLQDFEWFPRIFFAASKVAYLNCCLYFYRLHPNSILHLSATKCLYDMAGHFHSLAAFLATHSVPTDIQSIWCNQWLFQLCHQLYIWHTPSQNDRKASLKIFFASSPQKLFFWRFLSRGAWCHILALPLLWLASKGCHLPANYYFRKIYPTLEWRFRHLKVRI